MDRYKIIILFLVIHFIGEIISFDDEYYAEPSRTYTKKRNKKGASRRHNKKEDKGGSSKSHEELVEYDEKLLQITDAENMLYERLMINYYTNNAEFKVDDYTIFDIVYFYYTLFWESVNLRIRALVHRSSLIGESYRDEIIQKSYESAFENTAEIFENLKKVIRKYYNTTPNREIICGYTSSDSDAGSSTGGINTRPSSVTENTAESIWNELLKLNLDFIMSTDTLAKREYSSDNEYIDGLVKWSEIEQTNSFKTLLPTNFPDKINILKLSPNEEQFIKDYDNYGFIRTIRSKVSDYDDRSQTEVLQWKWCDKLMDFINTDINKNILNCFFTKLTGLSLQLPEYQHVARSFMLTDCPDEKKIKIYYELMQGGTKDVAATPSAIQMVRFTREWTNIFYFYSTVFKQLLMAEKKKAWRERMEILQTK